MSLPLQWEHHSFWLWDGLFDCWFCLVLIFVCLSVFNRVSSCPGWFWTCYVASLELLVLLLLAPQVLGYRHAYFDFFLKKKKLSNHFVNKNISLIKTPWKVSFYIHIIPGLGRRFEGVHGSLRTRNPRWVGHYHLWLHFRRSKALLWPPQEHTHRDTCK